MNTTFIAAAYYNRACVAVWKESRVAGRSSAFKCNSQNHTFKPLCPSPHTSDGHFLILWALVCRTAAARAEAQDTTSTRSIAADRGHLRASWQPHMMHKEMRLSQQALQCEQLVRRSLTCLEGPRTTREAAAHRGTRFSLIA